MLSARLLYLGDTFLSGTCCRYSRVRSVSISSREVSSAISMSANHVVMVVVTSVKMNVTVIVLFSCVVEESGFESEIGKEFMLEGEVSPLCGWSFGEVSDGGGVRVIGEFVVV